MTSAALSDALCIAVMRAPCSEAVDSSSAHPADAWEFLRWLNTARTSGRHSCTGEMLLDLGALTANRADLEASAKENADPFMKPFIDALAEGRALSEPGVLNGTEIEGILRAYIERAWLGILTPAQALAEADAVIDRILRESAGSAALRSPDTQEFW